MHNDNKSQVSVKVKGKDQSSTEGEFSATVLGEQKKKSQRALILLYIQQGPII